MGDVTEEGSVKCERGGKWEDDSGVACTCNKLELYRVNCVACRRMAERLRSGRGLWAAAPSPGRVNWFAITTLSKNSKVLHITLKYSICHRVD